MHELADFRGNDLQGSMTVHSYSFSMRIDAKLAGRLSWSIAVLHEGQLLADSVEKVGHGLRIRKVRVRD